MNYWIAEITGMDVMKPLFDYFEASPPIWRQLDICLTWFRKLGCLEESILQKSSITTPEAGWFMTRYSETVRFLLRHTDAGYR